MNVIVHTAKSGSGPPQLSTRRFVHERGNCAVDLTANNAQMVIHVWHKRTARPAARISRTIWSLPGDAWQRHLYLSTMDGPR